MAIELKVVSLPYTITVNMCVYVDNFMKLL